MVVRSLDPAVLKALEGLSLVLRRYTREMLDEEWKSFWTPQEQAWIEGRSVWDLPEDLMGFVRVNVVTVYGSALDLKYFLPRLLLEAVKRPGRESLCAVLRPARWADFLSWPQAERAALMAFLRSWWRGCLQEPVNFNAWPVEDALCAAAQLGGDLSPFLQEWRADERVNASLHLMNTARLLLADGKDELLFEAYWEECLAQAEQVHSWLLSDEVLERLQKTLLKVSDGPARQLLIETTQRLTQVAGR